jgi:hypothetical protein
MVENPRRKNDGLSWSIASILAGIGAAYVAEATILPSTPIVVASFRTFTAQAGYFEKSAADAAIEPFSDAPAVSLHRGAPA